MTSAGKRRLFFFVFILKICLLKGYPTQKETDKCIIKICDNSPIFYYQIVPEPTTSCKLRIGDVYNITLSGVMPHLFLGGYIPVHLNKWPFELQLRYECSDTHYKTDGMCYTRKGEKFNQSYHLKVDNKDIVLPSGHYTWNISLINQDDELMFCFDFDGYMIF